MSLLDTLFRMDVPRCVLTIGDYAFQALARDANLSLFGHEDAFTVYGASGGVRVVRQDRAFGTLTEADIATVLAVLP